MMWADMNPGQRADAIAALKDKGLSNSLIAAELGTTRNSVCGFVHRRMRPGPAKPTVRKAPPKKPGKPARKKRIAPLFNFFPQAMHVEAAEEHRPEAWDALPGSEPVLLAKAERHQCRWPVGEKVLFCGLPIAYKSYCATHVAMAYSKGGR